MQDRGPRFQRGPGFGKGNHWRKPVSFRFKFCADVSRSLGVVQQRVYLTDPCAVSLRSWTFTAGLRISQKQSPSGAAGQSVDV
jgi:hypothetical protein